MKSVRRAVIDVGTNSIKLLVAEVDRGQVKPLWEESKQTRLGKGFYDSHRLQPDAISRTAQAVAKFAHDAREYQVSGIRVIATSAARDAVNGRELTDAITAASGLRVEVISGDKEADWVFRGVTSDPALGAGASLLLDVGGGSSEFIVGRASQKVFAGSFALGTVRFLQLCPHSDPPTHSELGTCRSKIAEFLRNEVEPKVAPALKRAINEASDSPRLFATGGTATILARMEARLTGSMLNLRPRGSRPSSRS